MENDPSYAGEVEDDKDPYTNVLEEALSVAAARMREPGGVDTRGKVRLGRIR